MPIIRKLQTSNGSVIENAASILNEERNFYKNLYTHNENMSTDFNDFFFGYKNMKHLTKANQDYCDQPITLQECSLALKQMKNNKTPGTDGLSTEFYKMMWPTIAELVFESIQHAYQTGELSIDQKRGLIKLIPKKDKDITFLKNWRPISILNTDYKLIGNIIANRLQNVLHEIISTDQNGYIKNRFIGCNIRTIFDIIEASQENDIANMIVFLDFEKLLTALSMNSYYKHCTTLASEKNSLSG